MPAGKNPNNPSENPDNEQAFEYVDADSIEYVKRGRKPIANDTLIEKLANLPMGKALVINEMKLDPTSPKYASEKSKYSGRIRTACHAANMETFSILWSPNGVPQVKR